MKMENWEIQSMKDDMSVLSYNFQGTEVSETLGKALNYINDLEEKLVEIANDKERAIKTLRDNGYFVGRITGAMERDWKVCEKQNYEGDCSCCSCSICMMQ